MSPLPWLTLYPELRNPTAGAVGHIIPALSWLRPLFLGFRDFPKRFPAAREAGGRS